MKRHQMLKVKRVGSLWTLAFVFIQLALPMNGVWAHEIAPGTVHTPIMPASSGVVQNIPATHPNVGTTLPPLGPHADDPVKAGEHEALLHLVGDEHATKILSEDKNLSEVDIQEGERLVIAKGVTLWVDQELETKMDWIRVDGNLKFRSDRNTSLKVVTLVVNTTGYLEIGSENDRIHRDVTAKILLADRGPRDAEHDPLDLTGGLVSHGKTRMHGAALQSQARLSEAPKKGDTQLVLSEKVDGWRVGDILLLAGMNPDAVEDEQVRVTSISSDQKIVTFEHVADASQKSLRFNHDVSIPIGNLTKNIVIASEVRDDVSRRGHVMFMHSMDVVIDGAGFYGLGRTDGRQAVTDPVLDEHGRLIEGTDANTRGRYAVHFHMRTGAKRSSEPAQFLNSAIVDSPKFGMVNHGAYVVAQNNVTYDIDGSHYFMENGSEIGSVIGNLGIRSRGNGYYWKDPSNPNAKAKWIRDGQESRKDIFDFGFEGHFLWAQGGGVEVIDNFASGHANVAYIFFTTTIKEGGKAVEFLVENLHDGLLKDSLMAKNKKTIEVGSVPFIFSGNKATASLGALETKFHLLNVKSPEIFSVVENSEFWNNKSFGSRNEYTNQVYFRDVVMLSDESSPRGEAFIRNDVTRSLTYENLQIRGFKVGIRIPVNGTNRVIGGEFNNVVNIHISTTRSKGRSVEIHSDFIFFDTLSEEALKKAGAAKQMDIYMQSNFKPKDGDISLNFEPDAITAVGDDIRLGGKQIYFEEQAADYVPFKLVKDEKGKVLSNTLTGTELDGLSNQEMWERYRLAIGGVVAPVGAEKLDRIKGLVGEVAVYDPPIHLVSKRFTTQSMYVLKIKDATGRTVAFEPKALQNNAWNLVQVVIEGVARTVLIYQDSTAPEFIPNAKMMLPENFRIHPDDIAYGVKIQGQIKDAVGNLMTHHSFEKIYKLAKDPTKPKENEFVIDQEKGELVIKVRVYDKAGNFTDTVLRMKIDSSAPKRAGNVGFFGQPSFGKKPPVRQPNALLEFLIRMAKTAKLV